jgi:hypothetical protein
MRDLLHHIWGAHVKGLELEPQVERASHLGVSDGVKGLTGVGCIERFPQ